MFRSHQIESPRRRGLVLQFDHGDEYARYCDHGGNEPDETGFKEFIRFINALSKGSVDLFNTLICLSIKLAALT